jgi:thiamine transporter ThiT
VPEGPATTPVTRSVKQYYAVVIATPADVRGSVYWAIAVPKGSGPLAYSLLYKQINKPSEKNGGL